MTIPPIPAASADPADPQTVHPIVAQQQLSPQQLQAVLRSGSRLLVVAGAGTGKTKTLTARILHLLTQESTWAAPSATQARAAEADAAVADDADATPLRRIAAVTFTNKAARELRSRLRGQMAAYLRTGVHDGAERSRWERLLIDLEAAPIGTIHSLCTQILRAHPAEAELDPRFGVLEEGAAVGTLQAAVDVALAWAVEDEAGAQLLRRLGAGGLRTLCGELVGKRLDAAPALSAAAEAALRAEIDALRLRMAALLDDGELREQMGVLEAAAQRIDADPRVANDKLTPWIPQVLAAWQAACEALDAQAWPALAAALAELRVAARCTNGEAKNWLPLRPKAAFATLRTLFDEQLPEVVVSNPALDEQLLALLPALRALFAKLNAAYSAAKAEARMLDFDDLEARAIALLEANPAVRSAWQSRLLALLVDEFQDTNQRQRTLVELLSRAGDVQTFVGDPKQSIYRFRGASVEIMQRELAALAAALNAGGEDGAGGEGATGGEVLLSTSYRAHAGLIQLLNLLLAPILGGVGDPLRPPFEPLAASGTVAARVAGPSVELLLAQGSKGNGALNCAAHRLAARLQALHAAGFAWSEMAILCRRARSFEAYEDAFEAAGLPYVTVSGRGFYSRPEVRDVLNALRALDDPTDNLALLGLLRSPAVGLSDPLLFLLGRRALEQAHDAQSTSRSAVRSMARGMAPGALLAALRACTDAEAQRALGVVEELARQAGRAPVAALIKAFYDRTGYAVALTQAGQARGARNLAKLAEDALRSGETSVGEFLARVEVQQKGGAREGEALADAEGVVQIMTVHAAKGLQWPVVVIGDAAAESGGGRGGLLIEDGALYLHLNPAGALPGPLYRAAQQRADAANEAESDRLLYVAATRAEQLLLVSGNYGASRGIDLRGWLKRLTLSLNLEAQLVPLLAAEPPAPDGADAPLLDARVAAGAPDTPPAVAALLEPGRMVRLAVWSGAPDAPAAQTDRAAAATTEQAAQEGAAAAPATKGVHAPLVAPLVVEHAATPREPEPSAPARQEAGHAAGWVVGRIVHEALEEWRFPAPGDDPSFDGWVQARALSRGITDGDELAACLARVRRQLLALARHPLRREVDEATQRFHNLPYDRPPRAAGEPNPAPGSSAADDGADSGDSGSIDLLYRRRSDGRWVVVDFKTERIQNAVQRGLRLEEAVFVGPAQRQALAVQTLLDTTPETLLVFLDDGQKVSVERLLPP